MGRKNRKNSLLNTQNQKKENIQQTIKNNNDKDLENLKIALSQTLEQVKNLKKENEKLSKEIHFYEQNEKKLKVETEKIKLKYKKLEKEKRNAENIAKRSEYRFGRLEKKYSDLASSKLGRLTLNYWAWHNEHQKGKGSISNSFFIKWLFDRLPELQNNQELIEMPTQEITISKSDDKKEVVASASKKPVATEYEMPLEQQKWIEAYTDRIKSIPDSNGCRYYEKLQNKIGIVCDEFFYDSICSAANFVYLTPQNWKTELENGLDALLFVSAWRGLSEEWKGLAVLSNRIIGKNKIADMAVEMIVSFKEKGIPTIFYSKEDPPNYERFLRYAKECDYIFTSAAECIPYYNEECGRDDVKAVSFGINPTEHNPIGFYNPNKDKTVLFSGSWMEKYPQRCEEISIIFDGVLDSQYDLHIIDRNYPQNKKYLFPENYRQYTSPAVPHDTLQKLHKCFNYGVNINSVTKSETMFANRGFELQANGVLLLSNYSVGINSILPTVQITNDKDEVNIILNSFTDEELYERQISGIRSVMTGHTCFDRIGEVLFPTGISAQQPVRKVLVIADKITDNIKASFERQTYVEKTLIQSSLLTPNQLKKFDMVTWFADDTYYGVFYLEDMINGFKYTACDYITKDAWIENGKLNSGIEHNYVNKMNSKYRTVFWRDAFSINYLLKLDDNSIDLANGYSIDHFNYELNPVNIEKQNKDYLISVVVPVYNNGMHLYGKCFSSLHRSSMFNDMEIILVDDGSSDEYTLKIQEYLEHSYSNVKRYQFLDGGSGSASRPRNKGVELAKAKYIAFLDPDNEAVCDGYAKMFELARENNCELVIGGMYKFSDKIIFSNYSSIFYKKTQSYLLENGINSLLEQTKFIAPSIQAMLISKDLITKNNLEQVVGAAGQDSLFSWQLMKNAKRIYLTELPIHIYYARTSGSVTNTVKSKYFEKLSLLQVPKYNWLKENNLIESFMNDRYNIYTKGWIFNKLLKAPENEVENCIKIVKQILDVYSKDYNNQDDIINQFIKLYDDGKYNDIIELLKQNNKDINVRPMPTIKELLGETKSKKSQDVNYEIDGLTLDIENLSKSDGDKYAWVILLNNGAYEKIYSSKYSTNSKFTFDFSKLKPNNYKIRAFKMNGKQKVSDDVLSITISENGKVTVNKL